MHLAYVFAIMVYSVKYVLVDRALFNTLVSLPKN